jgi:hypothetical protein
MKEKRIVQSIKLGKGLIMTAIFAVILLAVYLTAFANDHTGNGKSSMPEIDIRKLDNIAAYKMVYKSDYKFDEFLKKGAEDDSELYDFLNSNGFHPHENLCGSGAGAFGCSCFTVKNKNGDVLFGRNFDWYSHPCTLVYTNPKGAYSSVSMVDLYYAGVSGFPFSGGSVFDNKHLLSIPYIPLDGVNERGVAIGVMSLPAAESPYDSGKKTISSLGAVRLVLDYAANVDEAVKLMSNYNIYFQKIPIHYMISDSSGKSVVVEYVEGKMNVVENEQDWQVSTNFVLSGYGNMGRGRDRYNTAEQKLYENHESMTKPYAMEILNNVSQGGETIWSIVYDLKKKDFDLCVGRRYDQTYSSTLF